MPILSGIPELYAPLSGTASAAEALAVLIPRDNITLGEMVMKVLRSRQEAFNVLVDSYAGRVIATNNPDVVADIEGFIVAEVGELVVEPDTNNFLTHWSIVSNTTFPIDVTQLFNAQNRLTLARIVEVLASHASKPFLHINQSTGQVSVRVANDAAQMSADFVSFAYQAPFTAAYDIKPKSVTKHIFE